ncbi:glycosyltransferase family 4 protein [Pyrobaculum islandicum]|nr:glycosyltransferase family 1 protein [Pyrobaculum islandicum]
MIIGITAWSLTKPDKRGIDIVTTNIISRILKTANDKYIFYLILQENNIKNIEQLLTETAATVVPLQLPKIRFLQYDLSLLFMPRMLMKTKLDVIHFTEFLPSLTPSFYISSVRKILTIYDLIPSLFRYLPTDYILKWRLLLKRVVKKVDMIITVSKNTLNDCVKYLQCPSEKIRVIYPGVDNIFKPLTRKEKAKEVIKTKYGVEPPFILYVGTLEPRKNVERLIASYYILKKKMGIKHRLILVGKKVWMYNTIFNLISKLGLSNQVVYIGYVDREDLPLFYNLADVFVYPSLYEGFGIPPLEAMACGTPVVTSNTSSLPEVVGNAALTVDPYNIDQLVQAIHLIISDEGVRKELSKRGIEQAQKFSWEKAAQETLKVYTEVSNLRS